MHGTGDESATGSHSPRVGSLGTGWGLGVSAGPAEGAGSEGAGRPAHPPCRLADDPSAAWLGPRPQPTGAAAGTQDAPLRRLRCSNMAACCAPEVRRASASGTWPALVTLDPPRPRFPQSLGAGQAETREDFLEEMAEGTALNPCGPVQECEGQRRFRPLPQARLHQTSVGLGAHLTPSLRGLMVERHVGGIFGKVQAILHPFSPPTATGKAHLCPRCLNRG